MPASNYDSRGVGNHTKTIDSFSMSAGLPLDDRIIIDDIATLNEQIPEYIRYYGMIVYCSAQDTYITYNKSNAWEVLHFRYGFGESDPTATDFPHKDLFINSVSADLFYKRITNSNTLVDPLTIGWTKGASLMGPEGEEGQKGDRGIRGSRWTAGTTITGTSTTPTSFPNSGINDALINDQYLNTDTGNTYQCTVEGDPSTAEWIYTGTIRGPQGQTGQQGEKGDTGEQGEKGDKGDRGSKIYSGATINGPTEDPVSFPNATDIADIDVLADDYYLNQDTGHLFGATTSGKGNAVLWMRQSVIKGSKLYTGTGMTHTGDGKFSSGAISYANVDDVYINLNTGMVYRCITEGDKDTAIWRSDSTIASIPQVFNGSTSSAAGSSGLVPAPVAGTATRFLSADGTWKEVDMSETVPSTGGDFDGPISAPIIIVGGPDGTGTELTQEMVDFLLSIMGDGSGGSGGITNINVSTITVGDTVLNENMVEILKQMVDGDTIAVNPKFNSITVGGVTLDQSFLQSLQNIVNSGVDLSNLVSRVTALENNYTTMNNKLTTTTNTANTAKTTAENAQSAANTAKTAADNAQSTANTAKSTADSANTKATNAQNTANTANTNATNAQNTANTALSNANAAKSVTDKYSAMLNIIGNGQ